MGLFDSFLPNPQPGSLLSDPDSVLAIAAGLIGGKKGEGLAPLSQGVMAGMQVQRQNRTEERANRSNELQQVQGAYKILKDIDQQQQWAALTQGQIHTPNPVLGQLEARLSELTSQNPMTRAGPMTTGAPTQQALPARSQVSGGMPGVPQAAPQAPQGQASPQATVGSGQGQIPFPKLLEMAGIQPSVAQGYIAANKPDKLLDAINEAFKIRGSGGNFVRLNPQSGQIEFLGGQVQPNSFPVTAMPGGGLQVQPVQGLNEAISGQTRAIEGAKSEFDLVTIPDGNGGTMSVPRSRALGIQPQQPQSQQAPQQTPRVASLQVTEPSRTASNGAPGHGLNPSDIAQQQALGKYYADTFTDSQTNAKAAQKGKYMNARIAGLLEGVDTGKLTPLGMEIASYAKVAGLDIDPKLGNKQAAQALSGQMALEMRSPANGAGMPGSMSDADREFLKSITPGLAQTPEGRKLILETKNTLHDRALSEAQMARNYIAKNGKLDHVFFQQLQDYADKHPLFNAPGNAEKVLRFDAQGNQKQ